MKCLLVPAPSNQEPPLTDVFYYSLPTLRAEGGRPRGYLPGAEGGIQGLHHLGFVHALLTCRHTIIQVLLYVHPVFRIQIGLALGSLFFLRGRNRIRILDLQYQEPLCFRCEISHTWAVTWKCIVYLLMIIKPGIHIYSNSIIPKRQSIFLPRRSNLYIFCCRIFPLPPYPPNSHLSLL